MGAQNGRLNRNSIANSCRLRSSRGCTARVAEKVCCGPPAGQGLRDRRRARGGEVPRTGLGEFGLGGGDGRRLQRCGATLVRRLVLALAEYGEGEGEQEDQDRDHDRECHPLAHQASSLEPRRGTILYQSGRTGRLSSRRVMYNVATCGSFVR
jgi:hypothetical protein